MDERAKEKTSSFCSGDDDCKGKRHVDIVLVECIINEDNKVTLSEIKNGIKKPPTNR